MKKLTKREKMLLYILLCVVIVAGGLFLFVIPSFQTYTTQKSLYETAQMELSSVKANAPDYTDLDKKIKDTTAKLKKLDEYFYTEMEKEDVDQIITSFAVEHLLTPIQLDISAAEAEELMSYKDYVANKDKKSSDVTKQTMSVYHVSLQVQGSVAQLQALVNDANQTYSMKVSSVEYDTQQDEAKTMKVTFKIYMMP